MKIAELIKYLNSIKEDSWDCEIKIEYDNWGQVNLTDIEVEYDAIDNKNYLILN